MRQPRALKHQDTISGGQCGEASYQSPGQGSLRESWNKGEPGDGNAARGGEERGETPSFFLLSIQIQLEVS